MKNEGTKWAIGGTKCANEGTKSKMKEQKNSPRTFYCLLRFSSIHNLNTILFSSNSEQLQTLNQETCDKLTSTGKRASQDAYRILACGAKQS